MALVLRGIWKEKGSDMGVKVKKINNVFPNKQTTVLEPVQFMGEKKKWVLQLKVHRWYRIFSYYLDLKTLKT